MEKRKVEKGKVDDLVLLDQISEDAVLKNLENRFNDNNIYSYIGDVLVSVNPFRQIPGLYEKSLMQRYYGKHTFELAPHVFAIAENAYRQLLSTTKDQAVLVSGESGAGKTEAAKKIMEYISQVSDDRAESNSQLSVREIKEALLNSNPVLESFGNAQTVRNDNSSRFGKYMVIQMDYNGVPVGGSIRNYLLEKTRVVYQSEGERTFHIFYQLCAAGGSNLRLGSASDYNYSKGTTKVKSIDDKKDFREMDSALGKVGVSSSDKEALYELVAGILHLGNITFETARGDKCEVSRNSSDALSTAADLFKVPKSALAKALTHRTISTRTDVVTSPLVSVDECAKTRDALAKALYTRAFSKLVELINVTIKTDMNELSFGVLDIYGFEIFERNSFGQLCINYCNEKLQQLFIELTLRAEQEEYDREGIEWEHIDFFDNKIVCDLVEGKMGIMAFLNEESIYPKGTDATYLKKMESNLIRHPHYQSLATKTSREPSEFTIKHYAGDVIYDVNGMLDANKDTLFRDLIELIGDKSNSDFLKELFPEAREAHDGKKPITAGTAFVRDMKLLIEDLEKCDPHYIRTIKPNSQKRGGVYDEELVRHQVRYLGLVENVRVRRAGFANRQDFGFFVKRYKMCSSRTWPVESGNDKRDTEVILKEVGVSSSDYEMGKTKVFIRKPDSVFKLEDKREQMLHVIAKIIQKAYRRYKARLYFLRLREQSVQLLHGKKCRRGSWVLYFLGDYVFAQDDENVTSVIDGRVKFADHVNVLDAKNKMVKHLLVMTASSVYIFTTKFNPLTRSTTVDKMVNEIPFRDIKQFGLSQFADGFMVLDFYSEKPKPTLIMESMRKAEITTVLNEEYSKNMRKDLNLKFQNEHQIQVLKKGMFSFLGSKIVPKVLSFVESDQYGLHNSATYHISATKVDNPDFKASLRIDVSPLLASKAQLQLDSELPDALTRFKGRKGTKKKVPYAGYRVKR